MRRTFAILCLFLASKSNVSAEKDELCNLDGLCINFLLEVTDLVLSKNECYLKCLRNLDCAWYTYNSEFGTCHLNMGCNDVVLLNQGFTRSYKDCRNQRTWKLVDWKIYNDLTSGKSIQSQSTTTEGSCGLIIGLIYHELRSYRFCNPPTFRSFDTHSCTIY